MTDIVEPDGRAPGRIVILNRFFYPDHSATAQIASDLGFHLAQQGYSVTAVCARLRYDGGEAGLAAEEVVNGVRIRRLATTRFGRGVLVGRLLDYASFYLLAFHFLIRALRRGDVVICKTDPPMLSIVAGWACRLRGAALVNWLQDLFPEVAQALGVGRMIAPVQSLLKTLRNRSLRRAQANVAIGHAMRDLIVANAVPAARVHVIPNWGDEAIVPVDPASNGLRAAWGITPQTLVVAYSGNLGRAHDYATIIDAAALLDGELPVTFLMIGDGAKTAQMQEAAKARGLDDRFLFKPYQPREQLSQSLGCGDIHWLSLDPALEGMIVPSKIYGILSAGRPFIFVGAAHGEVAQMVARHGGGFTVAVGDAATLAARLRHLVDDASGRQALGAQAREAASLYSRASALAQWTALIDDITRR